MRHARSRRLPRPSRSRTETSSAVQVGARAVPAYCTVQVSLSLMHDAEGQRGYAILEVIVTSAGRGDGEGSLAAPCHHRPALQLPHQLLMFLHVHRQLKGFAPARVLGEVLGAGHTALRVAHVEPARAQAGQGGEQAGANTGRQGACGNEWGRHVPCAGAAGQASCPASSQRTHTRPPSCQLSPTHST